MTFSAHSPRYERRPIARRGFTLIEVMIVAAIVAILAAIALPSYSNYVLRGRLVDATSGLTAMRADMERYFQDNRTYAATTNPVTHAAIVPPCQTGATVGLFTLSCVGAPGATTFKIQAVGGGNASGFTYTIDQANTHASAIAAPAPANWRATSTTCWILKAGQTC